jgi:hypothetical protein
MLIVGRYSIKGGQEFIASKYPHLLKEVENAIKSVKAQDHRTKTSEEKTMPGYMLYSPVSLNNAIKKALFSFGWKSHREYCEYSKQYYDPSFNPKPLNKGAFREMDFLKEKLGVEVQFGKYAFMVYNVCAKMTIFNRLGVIDAGIEIVPIKNFADYMSSGVSYFEQFVWDLEHRGIADIDIPVLIFGIDSDQDSINCLPINLSQTIKTQGTRPGPKPK